MSNAGAIAYSAATENVKENIKKTIDKEIPVPKKYRWLVTAAEEYGLINKKEQQSDHNTRGGLRPL
jgi:hypothetical protein